MVLQGERVGDLKITGANREPFIDVLRVVACIAVAVFHILESSCNNDPLVSKSIYEIVSAVSSALSGNVPVFLMITGYIWLNKDKACTYKKMYSNIRRFVLVLLSFGTVYAMMQRVFDAGAYSARIVVLALMDVFTGNLWDHMWYIYSIIGVYLVLPVLKPFFSGENKKSVGLFVLLLGIFTIVCPNVYQLLGLEFPFSFHMTSTLFYVCAGGYISNANLPRRKYLAAAGLICACALKFLFRWNGEGYESVQTILKCMSAFSLFFLLYSIRLSAKVERKIYSVAAYTFGVYLLHPLFINVLIKLFKIYPLRWCPPLSLALTSVVVLIASFLATAVLKKIPVVGKYIL